MRFLRYVPLDQIGNNMRFLEYLVHFVRLMAKRFEIDAIGLKILKARNQSLPDPDH